MENHQHDQVPKDPDSYTEVSDPTWHDNIKLFFRQFDKNCMGAQGIKLGQYQQVKDKASSIYSRVKRREGPKKMPTDLTWSMERVNTFKNWTKNDFKVGTLKKVEEVLLEDAVSTRERKNINDLSEQEKKDLIKAFKEIMNRKPDEANSYYSVASIHGLPSPYDCVHGSEQFNHWHRLYLLQMENALRSVPGCEHVTLPYWDITEEEMPALLSEEPFLSYTIPASVPGIGSYQTRRNSDSQIMQLVHSVFRIPDDIANALGQKWYEDFWEDMEDNSHDPGHGSIGGSNSNTSYPSYDPIFWFFHCNWDRLMWEWQKKRIATTVTSFKANMKGEQDWLELNMKSGSVRAKPIDLIDNNSLDLAKLGLGQGIISVSYKKSVTEIEADMPEPLKARSISGDSTFRIPDQPMASVMLKGVQRLNVEGGFHIHLYAGDKIIASTYEFQFLDPTKCENCVSRPIRNYTMKVPVSELVDDLRVEIRLPDEDNTLVDMIDVGNPTLNIRLLLE